MVTIAFIPFFIFFYNPIQVTSQPCYALSLGGGGAFGAYQVGSFSALTNLLPQAQSNYSAFVGISVGSLNSLMLSQFPQGSNSEASSFLNTVWTTLNGSSSIFKEFTGGLIGGILFHSGMLNTSPLFSLMKSKVTKLPARKVSMGTIEMNSGEFQMYKENNTLEVLQHASMCSSAIPFFFEDQDLNGGVYGDGGGYNMFDAAEPVRRCLEVTDESQVVVDIISLFREELAPDGNETLKTLDVFFRAFEITSYDLGMDSLEFASEAYPKANFRYFVQPSKSYMPYQALDFNLKFLENLISLGYNDTQKVIQSSEPFNVKSHLKKRKQIILFP